MAWQKYTVKMQSKFLLQEGRDSFITAVEMRFNVLWQAQNADDMLGNVETSYELANGHYQLSVVQTSGCLSCCFFKQTSFIFSLMCSAVEAISLGVPKYCSVLKQRKNKQGTWDLFSVHTNLIKKHMHNCFTLYLASTVLNCLRMRSET